MRFLTTSVAIIAILGSSAGAWGQDGQGLRDALTEVQTGRDIEAPETDLAETLLDAAELDQLVAPVALYPDALLAQVLVASAYPLQVVKADQLISASADMSEDEMAAEIGRQDFDPSLLVLMSGFPTVVGRMADDIDWTERLGNAMLAQDEDVLASVQRMRAEAEAAGNLTSNAAQVVEQDAGQISIRPADPEVVYVPSYDPVRTYTTPNVAYAPATSGSGAGMLANPLVAGALAFGGALLVQQLLDDGGSDSDRNGRVNYWHDSQPIDWRDRQVYPRGRHGSDHRNDRAWSRDRDDYWNAGERRWRDDRKRSAERHEMQRALFGETVAPAPTRERMRAAARERALAREAAPEDRAAAGRRAERVKAAARRDERAKAMAAREAREKPAEKPKARAERPRPERRAVKAEPARDEKARKPAPAKAKPKAQKAAAKPEKAKKAAAKKPEAAKKAVRKAEPKPTVQKAAAKAERKPVRKADAKPKREKAAKAERKPVRKADAKPKREKAAKAERKPVRKADAKPKWEKAAKTERKPVREAEARPERKAAKPHVKKAAAPEKAVRAAKVQAKQKPAKAEKKPAKRKKCDPKKQDCQRK